MDWELFRTTKTVGLKWSPLSLLLRCVSCSTTSATASSSTASSPSSPSPTALCPSCSSTRSSATTSWCRRSTCQPPSPPRRPKSSDPHHRSRYDTSQPKSRRLSPGFEVSDQSEYVWEQRPVTWNTVAGKVFVFIASVLAFFFVQLKNTKFCFKSKTISIKRKTRPGELCRTFGASSAKKSVFLNTLIH